MSLDLTLICGCCNEELENFNITYNVSEMWAIANFPDKKMMPFEGLTAISTIPTLVTTIDLMRKNPEQFSIHNPKNGWGSYESFLEILEKMLLFSKKYPNSYWKAWR